MRSGRLTGDAWRQATLKMVAEVGASLDPEDDWSPVLILEGVTRAHFVDLSHYEMRDRAMRQNLVEKVVPTLFSTFHPVMQAAFVWPAWEWTHAPKDAKPGDLDPKDADEIVMVQMLEGEVEKCYVATVIRGGEHPKLGEWREKNDEKSGGTMHHILLNSYRKAAATWPKKN